MVTVHQLSRQDARRVAVRAQLLDRPRPHGLFEVVHQLTVLQNDRTAAVAPNADLVVWSRLGSSYAPAELGDALDGRALLEFAGMIRPGEDLALYRAEMAEYRSGRRGWPGVIDWVRANDGCRRDLLARLERGGPQTARELPDTCTVPWRSTGWSNNRNVTRMLECLARRGEVAVAGLAGFRARF